MTLPLIYTLNNCDKKTKKKIINIVKNHNENAKKVKEVIDIVINGGGLQYTAKKMKEYQKEALDILHKYPDNEARRALEGLVNYTINREK